jgi:ferritin-like metal-binding protein YciE
MEKLIDLRDLLKHEILDLHSAEEQIIDALPVMIEKANNKDLKAALTEHLKITEKQKERLEEIQMQMGEGGEAGDGEERKPGFFSKLFGDGGQKCRGMEGLITEGNKMMGEDMSPEVMDAAIIASAQKIEHYEICGYGTARAFANELQLSEISNKLTETLNEEYRSDDMLTELAVGKLNIEAESATGNENGSQGRKLRTSAPSKNTSRGSNGQAGNRNSQSSQKTPSKKTAAKSAPKKAVSNTSGRSSSGNQNRSSAPSKAAAKKAPAKSAATKKTATKKTATKKASPKKTSSNNRGGGTKTVAKKGGSSNNRGSGRR